MIKRDPVKDPPVDGQEIFFRAIDGENMLGEYGFDDDGDPMVISDTVNWMSWALVECWAPAEWTDAPTYSEADARAYIVDLIKERDRAIEERDALGLQLAALRTDNERMAKVLEKITLIVEEDDRDDAEGILWGIHKIIGAALTHGVDVTKEGE
jgi:hypothetical protein